MNNLKFAFLLIVIFISTCKRNGETEVSCLDYVDAEFQYPPFPENGWKTDNWFEESISHFAIPENILECISTRNLISTCLNHPQKLLFFAYNSWQAGFEICVQQCNGFPELFNRQDAGSIMLERYLNMNPFDKNLSEHDFLRFEIFISQFIILSKLTTNEKYILLQHLFNLNEDKIKAGFKYTEGEIGGYVTMGRMMHLDDYKPFMEEFNRDSMVLLRIFVIEAQWRYNDSCKPDEIISKHALKYLESLKQ